MGGTFVGEGAVGAFGGFGFDEFFFDAAEGFEALGVAGEHCFLYVFGDLIKEGHSGMGLIMSYELFCVDGGGGRGDRGLAKARRRDKKVTFDSEAASGAGSTIRCFGGRRGGEREGYWRRGRGIGGGGKRRRGKRGKEGRAI